MLALTRTGERPLAPTFGLPDPTFAGFDPHLLVAAVNQWGPDTTINNIALDPGDDVQTVTVNFG